MARDRTDFADRIRPPAPKGAEITVARLEAALLKVAMLMEHQPRFTPIFERLEAELAAAQEAEANGPSGPGQGPTGAATPQSRATGTARKCGCLDALPTLRSRRSHSRRRHSLTPRTPHICILGI